eukprot:6542815-Alexandrium_andersonii.AAC.1
MSRSTLVRPAERDGSRFVLALFRPAARQHVYIWTRRALKTSTCGSGWSIAPAPDEAPGGNSEEGVLGLSLIHISEPTRLALI